MKKATGAGGRRKRSRPTAAKKPKTPKKQTRVETSKKKAKTKTKAKPGKARQSGKPAKPPASSVFEVRELDPVRKCGPDTSVEQLYRVDERVNGQVRTHLVFFDRHGWYCEHGRDCPAVAPARKAGIHARHARHTGPTNHGRTRA